MAAGSEFHSRPNRWGDRSILHKLRRRRQRWLCPILRGGSFPHEWLSPTYHQQMYPPYHVLRQFCTRQPEALRRAQVLIDVYNQSVVDAFKRGQAKDPETNALLFQIFELQVDVGFLLTLKWIPTASNEIADAISQQPRELIFATRHLSDDVERAGPVLYRPYGIHSVRAARPSESPYIVVCITVRYRGLFGSAC